MSYRVGLLVPGFDVNGGVTTVGLFLRTVLQQSDRFRPDIISPAMGALDPASSQLSRPSTWIRGPRTEEKVWKDIPYRHVGARWSEFEFQRYRPRPCLTELLQDYDLVQIVAGTPPWAHLARHVDVPVALQVATLTTVERDGQHVEASLPRRLWYAGMTRLVSQDGRRRAVSVLCPANSIIT